MSAIIYITKRKTIVKFSEGQHEKSWIFQIVQKRTILDTSELPR